MGQGSGFTRFPFYLHRYRYYFIYYGSHIFIIYLYDFFSLFKPTQPSKERDWVSKNIRKGSPLLVFNDFFRFRRTFCGWIDSSILTLLYNVYYTYSDTLIDTNRFRYSSVENLDLKIPNQVVDMRRNDRYYLDLFLYIPGFQHWFLVNTI